MRMLLLLAFALCVGFSPAAAEDKKKETAGYKSPVKPIGNVTFTIQAKDRAFVDAFVNALTAQQNIYTNVSAPSGGGLVGSGSTTQTFTVRAGVTAPKSADLLRND